MSTCLEIDFCGIHFKNPLVVGSGPPTASLKLLKRAEDAGAAGASTKLAFRKVPFKGKLRSMYFPGAGLLFCIDKRLSEDEGLELIRRGRKETDLILFANITHPYDDPEGWTRIARLFEEAGAHILELNFTCPHIGISSKILKRQVEQPLRVGASIGERPELATAIIRAVKEVVKIPVVPKPMALPTLVQRIARACAEGGADGLTIGSGGGCSLPPLDLDGDEKPLYPLLEGVSFGSVVGKAFRYDSFGRTAQVARTVNLPLVSVGGMESWRQAADKVHWGATLVSTCTAIMVKGFGIIGEILTGLEAYMERKGYASLSDFRGRALKYLCSSDEVQIVEGVAIVDPLLCTGCGSCLAPGHCTAITLEDEVAHVNPKQCIGCAICSYLCPADAIHMEPLQTERCEK